MTANADRSRGHRNALLVKLLSRTTKKNASVDVVAPHEDRPQTDDNQDWRRQRHENK
jgi:hypothetical protein